jgi:hypothetical protein
LDDLIGGSTKNLKIGRQRQPSIPPKHCPDLPPGSKALHWRERRERWPSG